jgi:ribA/ribD-fused uncharacterized protein
MDMVMTLQINEFRGEYRFLSNFYPCALSYKGEDWPTVEHAYQAAKTIDPIVQQYIKQSASPGQAKQRGRSAKWNLTPNWDKKKLDIMTDLVTRKFTQNVELMRLLLGTQGHELIEGNKWGDTYWGVCNGEGENHLGKILMNIRDNYIIVGNKVRKAASCDGKVDRRDD